jgi:hypothetical protein
MRWAAVIGLLLGAISAANAQCPAVPNQLTNGQIADATQVMADFNALLNCINTAPGGSTGALQYNSGSGVFGGVGPLTNGQLAIGSTGGAPQAGNLIAGTGITITNGSGSITVAASGGGGSGLQLISTLTANNTSNTLAWTGLPTGTANYLLKITGLQASSTTGVLYLQIGEGSGPTWETTNYQYGYHYTFYNGIDGTKQSTSAPGILITGTSSQGTGQYDAEIEIHNLPSTSNYVTAMYRFVEQGGAWGAHGTGEYSGDNTTAKTAIRIITDTGNLVSGSASLYALSN